MKFSSIKYLTSITISTAIILLLASCVKEKFSSPTITNADPAGIQATMTIKQFKTIYYLPNQNNPFPFQIKDSIILSGVINGDDRSGNIYKTLIFQDSTGGLQVVADQSDLYNTYPVGTRIFIKCKGLYMYNYLGTLELGSYVNMTGAQPSLGGIPPVNIPTYIVKGQTGLTVTPRHWTLFNLTNAADQLNDQSTLIQVDSVQFTTADTSMKYADAINFASGNLVLQDNTKPTPNTVTVRSSGFANFANTKPPVGFGSVVGIFTIYQLSNGSTVNQITIRDTTDIHLTNPRHS
jgi:hypothetical protein